uniref:NACHT domain-containing protein n=1 Tax=Xanthomonas sp. 0924 TaxID=2835534 RepID=UPI003F7DF310
MKLLPFARQALKGVANAKDIIEFDFQKAHIAYCTSVLKNYCKARTFFVRDEPQYLEEFYIPTSILSQSRDRKRLARANLEVLRKVGPHVIVDGTGGSGKTVFMRYLMLDSIERGIAYPVLLELRRLNEDHEISLEGAIIRFLMDNGFPLGEHYAKRALDKGQLVLLLDGLDEVNFSRRKRLVSEIRRLSTSTDCQIVVSSRPDLTLEGWDHFSRVRMAPLELEEACELVEKIHFDDDDEVKARFINSLRAGLFESHKSFLSNPLLLSIMLLTYGHSADIPKRFSSFYERAYIALFEKHDAYKGYRRERLTDLDISEFSSIFAAFSTVTYNEGVFRFSPTDAIQYVSVAKRLASSRDVSESGFIDDAKQAVCLLVDEGLELAFVHRSFQEYFAAKYIQGADRKVQKALVERYGTKGSALFSLDNVLRYLYELAPTVVEEFYLIPSLSKIFGDAYKRRLSLTRWKAIITSIFTEVHKEGDDAHIGFVVPPSEKSANSINLFNFVRDICLNDHYEKMFAARDNSQRLSEYLDLGSTSLNSFSNGSPFWRTLADTGTFYSMEDMDRMRVELSEMERRVEKKRATELEFLVGGSRR